MAFGGLGIKLANIVASSNRSPGGQTVLLQNKPIGQVKMNYAVPLWQSMPKGITHGQTQLFI
jgi:hypothetical protein